MRISAIFPSKYITCADLQGRTVTLTITTVTLEEMQTHDNKRVQKPVCWFERTNKGLVLNATNGKIIAALYSDETNDWAGQRVSLYPTTVKAFGQVQPCIRVREEIPAAPKPVVPAAAPVEESAGLDDDEDVADYEDEGNGAPDAPAASLADPTLWEPDTGPERATVDQLDELDALGKAFYGDAWEAKLPKLVEGITTGATTAAAQLSPAEADRLIVGIRNKQAAAVQSTNGAKPVANGAVAK